MINFEEGDYTYKSEDFKINEGLIDALKIFRKKGYKLVVITNQSGIAKKIYSHADVDRLHTKLKETLLAHDIELSAIYYCPHHPDVGDCICRKPQSMMVEKALARFNIDPVISFLIGDRERDIIAGGTVGVRGILIDSNSSLMEIVSMIP